GPSSNADALFTAYMNSPEHRANILDPSYRYLGIATVFTGSYSWNTMDFVDQYSGTSTTSTPTTSTRTTTGHRTTTTTHTATTPVHPSTRTVSRPVTRPVVKHAAVVRHVATKPVAVTPVAAPAAPAPLPSIFAGAPNTTLPSVSSSGSPRTLVSIV